MRTPVSRDRVLLVGENNPYSDDGYFALYPKPEGASGYQLAVVILGMKPSEYLKTFDRVDLLYGRWSIPRAREVAQALTHPRRVLLGAKVAAAHGVDYDPFRVIGPCTGCYHCGYQQQKHMPEKLLVWPHPSRRNARMWTPEAIATARRQIVEFLR